MNYQGRRAHWTPLAPSDCTTTWPSTAISQWKFGGTRSAPLALTNAHCVGSFSVVSNTHGTAGKKRRADIGQVLRRIGVEVRLAWRFGPEVVDLTVQLALGDHGVFHGVGARLGTRRSMCGRKSGGTATHSGAAATQAVAFRMSVTSTDATGSLQPNLAVMPRRTNGKPTRRATGLEPHVAGVSGELTRRRGSRCARKSRRSCGLVRHRPEPSSPGASGPDAGVPPV